MIIWLILSPQFCLMQKYSEKLVSLLTNALYKMNILKLKEILRNFDLIKHDFSSNTKRKNFFLCTGNVLNPNINLKEMDQKFPFGCLIGYGYSCMVYFFANSKIFRLDAIYMMQLDLLILLLIRDLVIVMFYLDFQVLVFLVT